MPVGCVNVVQLFENTKLLSEGFDEAYGHTLSVLCFDIFFF